MNFMGISKINHLIDVAISRTVRIPYDGVAHDPETYLAQTSRTKIVKKFLHKYLTLFLRGQTNLERKVVPKGSKILWIYLGKRNFGDANMDISGRALLGERGYDIDLFTYPNLQELFEQDDIFKHVYSKLEHVVDVKYDFILLSEYNLPSLRFKSMHFKKVPFACLFGFFLGPARNQTCFSYAAINALFELGYTPSDILNTAKPHLHALPEVARSVSGLVPKGPFLAISIGGRDADRSYRHWPTLLHLLDQSHFPEVPKTIVLLGSDNGLSMAEQIMKEPFSNLTIYSYVDQLSLLQSRELISMSRFFIGCDGGLMHVAHSTRTPSVTLFRAQEPHHLWLTKSCCSLPIQSSSEDSAIEPQQILDRLVLGLRKTRELALEE